MAWENMPTKETRVTTMTYIEEHSARGKDIKGGWIMVLIAVGGLVILSL